MPVTKVNNVRKTYKPVGNITPDVLSRNFIIQSYPVSAFKSMLDNQYRLGSNLSLPNLIVLLLAWAVTLVGAVSFRCGKSRRAYVPRKWNVAGTHQHQV
jgi:hypothetical protein